MRLAWRVGLILAAMVAVLFTAATDALSLADPVLNPAVVLLVVLGASLIAAVWRYRPGA